MQMSFVTWNTQGKNDNEINRMIKQQTLDSVMLQELGKRPDRERKNVGTSFRPVFYDIWTKEAPGAKNPRCTTGVYVKGELNGKEISLLDSVSTLRSPVELKIPVIPGKTAELYVLAIHAVSSGGATMEIAQYLHDIQDKLNGHFWIFGGDFNQSPDMLQAALCKCLKIPFKVGAPPDSTQKKGKTLDYFVYNLPDGSVQVTLASDEYSGSDHLPIKLLWNY